MAYKRAEDDLKGFNKRQSGGMDNKGKKDEEDEDEGGEKEGGEKEEKGEVCPHCKKKMQRKGNAPRFVVKDLVREYFNELEEAPNDDDLHSFAEEHGVDTEDFEDAVYELLFELLKKEEK